MYRLLIALLFIAGTGLHAEAQNIRVLGIGNSFTGNAFKFLGAISESSDACDISYTGAIIGGCSLERHVRHLKEHEADPATGQAYKLKGKKASLKELLKSQQWDVVTIQQVSKFSPLIETYRPYAAELVAYIKEHAPQAQIMLHQTWAYRVDGDFDKVWPDKKGYTQQDMYKESAAAYQTIAKELDLKLIPVGAAFQLARERQPYVPPDLSALKPGDPIPQAHSLNVGYRWHKGKELKSDSHHASREGCVLAGLVWFATLTGEDVTGLALKGLEIPAERLQFLQQVAHDVAITGLRPSIQPE